MNIKHKILALLCLLAITTVAFLPAIPQDVLYHNFADQLKMFDVANFLNVVSNVPFILVGCAGIYALLSKRLQHIIPAIDYVYLVFFLGVLLTGLGSSVYHLVPTNASLLWDRLPMVISFMSFFTIIIAEFVSIKLAKRLFFVLIITGLFSVLYWHLTETMGAGDLRLYVLVQFLPVLLTPVIIVMFPSRFNKTGYIWLMLACYVLAKVFEYYDHFLFDLLDVISGHSLKHLASALATLLFLSMLATRVGNKEDELLMVE